MTTEEENNLLRGIVVDSNTDIDAYLELRKENESLKKSNEVLRSNLRELKEELYSKREQNSFRNKILSLFKGEKGDEG